MRDWLCNAAQVDVRKGGRIYLWWNNGYYTGGAFTQVQRYDSLSFTWQGPGEPTSEVQVSLHAEGTSTEIVVAHNGLLSSETAGTLGKLWETALENLQTLLETGNDLRLLRRPMFGLNGVEEMTPELASQLGSPISEGLRLGGVLPGMGAEAAGLQKDDIVTALDGRDVPNFAASLPPLSLTRQATTCRSLSTGVPRAHCRYGAIRQARPRNRHLHKSHDRQRARGLQDPRSRVGRPI